MNLYIIYTYLVDYIKIRVLKQYVIFSYVLLNLGGDFPTFFLTLSGTDLSDSSGTLKQEILGPYELEVVCPSSVGITATTGLSLAQPFV